MHYAETAKTEADKQGTDGAEHSSFADTDIAALPILSDR